MNTNKLTYRNTNVDVKWSWEQDGSGGDHGTLTLWPDSTNEISITMSNFKSAFELTNTITAAMNEVFEKGQRSLANKILDQIEDFVM